MKFDAPWVWLSVILALAVVGLYGVWMIRARARRPSRSRRVRGATSAQAALHGGPKSRQEDDFDERPYMDMPANRPASAQREAPASAATTQPVKLDTQAVRAAQEAGADRVGLARIHKALDNAQDSLNTAWAALKNLMPEPGQKAMALETMERLAQDFEAAGRYDTARDVYEHMADLDPAWPDVRAKLARARELAMQTLSEARPAVAASNGPQQRIGRYLVRGEIGRGAMGAVYLATDPRTSAKVAIKTMALNQEFQGSELEDARVRFLREAEMAGRLAHPDIVHILEAGEDKGVAFIAMEYVDGTDMGFFTKPGRLLPVPQTIDIVARVAEALAYAHTRGITHRDIKPANIMVNLEKGVVKVMDFGVARVADMARTRTGVVLGTPTYMSPEQLSGQNVDGRSDLYSLGVTLFQLLTGQLPYQSESMAGLMRAIARQNPPRISGIRPELPPALDDIVGLALQKHPNTRYSSGQQLAEDLRAL